MELKLDDTPETIEAAIRALRARGCTASFQEQDGLCRVDDNLGLYTEQAVRNMAWAATKAAAQGAR